MIFRLLNSCKINLEVHLGYCRKRSISWSGVSWVVKSGTSVLIFARKVLRSSLYKGHLNKKCISSSTSFVSHKVQILSSGFNISDTYYLICIDMLTGHVKVYCFFIIFFRRLIRAVNKIESCLLVMIFQRRRNIYRPRTTREI